ncbi:MAG: hypothetical protein QOI29_2252 [Mycobacterium sp.]|jgi:hypothetical protein|nr:hypothetical protein [Mycobacterium sp.]
MVCGHVARHAGHTSDARTTSTSIRPCVDHMREEVVRMAPPDSRAWLGMANEGEIND